MGNAWMGFKNILNNQRGQSMVEYILLLAVVVAISATVLKSGFVSDYFGEDGTFTKNFKLELEYSYRHAVRGRKANSVNYTSPNHDSYKFSGDTRFFGPLQRYPQ
jgi:hypothetical protein